MCKKFLNLLDLIFPLWMSNLNSIYYSADVNYRCPFKQGVCHFLCELPLYGCLNWYYVIPDLASITLFYGDTKRNPLLRLHQIENPSVHRANQPAPNKLLISQKSVQLHNEFCGKERWKSMRCQDTLVGDHTLINWLAWQYFIY